MSRPEKTVGNLTIYDNGLNGLSYRLKRIREFGWYMENGEKKPFIEDRSVYNNISNDDMLDYTLEENFPYYSDLTEKEKEFFITEYNRIKRVARHSDYYDAYDNTWKNYEEC